MLGKVRKGKHFFIQKFIFFLNPSSKQINRRRPLYKNSCQLYKDKLNRIAIIIQQFSGRPRPVTESESEDLENLETIQSQFKDVLDLFNQIWKRMDFIKQKLQRCIFKLMKGLSSALWFRGSEPPFYWKIVSSIHHQFENPTKKKYRSCAATETRIPTTYFQSISWISFWHHRT